MGRSGKFWTALFGHAVFIALLALAWEHAAARICLGDTGFQFFKWVNNPLLDVEAHRYTAIIPQLAVKAFRFFHADLTTLVLVASLAPVLVAYGIFATCLYLLEAPRSALAVALAAVLCTRLTFYAPAVEANYLLSYPFLFVALLESRGREPWRMPAILGYVAALALVLLVNPLGWLILLFGVAFLWSEGAVGMGRLVPLAGSVVGGALIVRLLFPPTAYERAQYGKLQAAMNTGGLHGPWASWDFLVGHTFHYTTNYLPALVLLALIVLAFGWKRKWLPLAVTLGGITAFTVLALVTFRSGDDAVMMDRAFLPLGTLLALPAAFLLPTIRGRGLLVGITVLLAITFIKVRDISFASRQPRKQVERITVLADELRERGDFTARLDQGELHERGIQTPWAFPFTAMLVSSMDGPDHSVVVELGPAPEEGADKGTGFRTPMLDGFLATLSPTYFGYNSGGESPANGR